MVYVCGVSVWIYHSVFTGIMPGCVCVHISLCMYNVWLCVWTVCAYIIVYVQCIVWLCMCMSICTAEQVRCPTQSDWVHQVSADNQRQTQAWEPGSQDSIRSTSSHWYVVNWYSVFLHSFTWPDGAVVRISNPWLRGCSRFTFMQQLWASTHTSFCH